MSLFFALGLLVLLTFLPGLEARASIPLAFFHKGVREALGLPVAVLACFLANTVVGIVTYGLMGPAVNVLRRWGWFERRVWPWFERTQHKLHPYVEKYGEWGLAVFIGVPLPGTGAYTGAFGAFLLGMSRRKFLVANVLGVLIACAAVTAVCLLVDRGAVAEDSLLRKLFLKSVKIDE